MSIQSARSRRMKMSPTTFCFVHRPCDAQVFYRCNRSWCIAACSRKVPFESHADHEDWAWLLEAWHLGGARVKFAWEPLVVYNIATESISRSRRVNWQDSLAWAQEYRQWIGDRAFASFLSTKVALKAKRSGDKGALRSIGQLILRSHPTILELGFFAGISLLPGALLHRMWKRSLDSRASQTAAPAQTKAPA